MPIYSSCARLVAALALALPLTVSAYDHHGGQAQLLGRLGSEVGTGQGGKGARQCGSHGLDEESHHRAAFAVPALAVSGRANTRSL